MKRKLMYSGFLGFLGLLGLFMGNPAFYGLFNFFGFWGLLRQKQDEMLILNSARSGLNAFYASIAAITLTIILIGIFKNMAVATICIGLTFTVEVLTYVISLNYYEKRGNL